MQNNEGQQPASPAQPPCSALLRLCKKVQSVDDALGKRSDHEGDENGPTHILFTTCTAEQFAAIAEHQIREHGKGARLWKELAQLHAQNSGGER